MKALTVRQPHVFNIFHRDKDIENRSWSTSYRGPLLIHAARKIDWSYVDKSISHDDLNTGVIYGVVELVDCIQNSRSKWADAGCYHWIIKNPRVLATPISYNGQLGLFTVNVPKNRLVFSSITIELLPNCGLLSVTKAHTI